MNKEIAGGPAYAEEFKTLLDRIENREATKKMSDTELHCLRTAINDEIIRREVVRHIQILADQLK